MVDVKSGNPRHPSVSQIPFDGYADDVIIARKFGAGVWRGARKRDVNRYKSGPIPPSHNERGTFFYRFLPKLFRPLSEFLRPNHMQFGLGLSTEEKP
jgi:hypothetical protein